MPSLDSDSKRPRLQDIAERLGVSIGTVSRVLSGKAVISSEVSKKILDLAREMDYEPRNSHAKTGGRKKAELGAIGYLIDRGDIDALKRDSFYQFFLAGVQLAAERNGDHVIYMPCGAEVAKNALPSLVTDRIVRGVVLKPQASTPDSWIQKLNAQVPVVLLMANRVTRQVPSVACDNASGVFQALRYLRELGHHRIGFVSVDDVGISPALDHEERLQAFLKYAPLLGIEMSPQYVQVPTRDHSRQELAEVMSLTLKSFLALGKARPTAVICAADLHAFSFIQVAAAQGLLIPGDFSVIGLRNTVACDLSNPSLTSLSVQEDEIGRRAVELLQQRIEAPGGPVCHISVAMKFIERLSCAKPPVL